MEAQERVEGRAQVSALFWDRLDEAGMTRQRGMTCEVERELRRRVCEKLAYMDADNLRTLADLVIDNGSGRDNREIMKEVTLLSTAKALQAPPLTEHRIVNSWLASKEGPPAVAGGYEVELWRHLRRRPVPPGPYDMSQIRDRANAAARRIEVIGERIARSVASDDDRKWLEAYLRDRQAVARIVASGQSNRRKDEVA